VLVHVCVRASLSVCSKSAQVRAWFVSVRSCLCKYARSLNVCSRNEQEQARAWFMSVYVRGCACLRTRLSMHAVGMHKRAYPLNECACLCMHARMQ
jgi:hypothetical protein